MFVKPKKSYDFCFLSFPLFLLYHVVLSLCGWVVMGGCGGGGLVFQLITLSQPNNSYGCACCWGCVCC